MFGATLFKDKWTNIRFDRIVYLKFQRITFEFVCWHLKVLFYDLHAQRTMQLQFYRSLSRYVFHFSLRNWILFQFLWGVIHIHT